MAPQRFGRIRPSNRRRWWYNAVTRKLDSTSSGLPEAGHPRQFLSMRGPPLCLCMDESAQTPQLEVPYFARSRAFRHCFTRPILPAEIQAPWNPDECFRRNQRGARVAQVPHHRLCKDGFLAMQGKQSATCGSQALEGLDSLQRAGNVFLTHVVVLCGLIPFCNGFCSVTVASSTRSPSSPSSGAEKDEKKAARHRHRMQRTVSSRRCTCKAEALNWQRDLRHPSWSASEARPVDVELLENAGSTELCRNNPVVPPAPFVLVSSRPSRC